MADTRNRTRNSYGKVLTVKRIDIDGKQPEQLPAVLDSAGIAFERVDVANWPEANAYTPQAAFRIAHCGHSIIIHYRATESSVAATADSHGQRVWEDSCMEFFCSPDGDDHYYNFECNCAGALLLCHGVRGRRHDCPETVRQSVRRWASLGSGPFTERVGACTWQVVMVIPATALFEHRIASVAGLTMRANFYKCGDRLQQPHFLSWNPISWPEPCFHTPECFGTIVFEP